MVVAAPDGAAAPDELVDTLEGLLAAAGWEVDGREPGVTLPSPVPTPDGEAPALTGGALEAVLLRWEQVR